jgi:hypothetical protein
MGGVRQLAQPALAALVFLMLFNGVLNPYGEQRVWHRFKPIVGVPAFKGIWTSPVKIEAIDLFRTLSGPGTLQGKRLLVIGPHPWLYFVLGGQPSTPMLFMHYQGREEAYSLVAEKLFRDGMPDAILLTNMNAPGPIAGQLGKWAQQDYTVRSITLQDDFIQHYGQQTGYYLPREVILLARPPVHP